MIIEKYKSGWIHKEFHHKDMEGIWGMLINTNSRSSLQTDCVRWRKVRETAEMTDPSEGVELQQVR